MALYVTVGTTQFDALVKRVTSTEVLRILKEQQYKKVIVQYGTGEPVEAETISHISQEYGIQVEQYKFKFETVRTDIIEARLVIGHAGAGTCMDILNYKKPGLVVVNDALMDNHQMELARKLSSEGHLYYCHLDELAEKLRRVDFGTLQPWEDATENLTRFIKALDELIS